MKVGDLVEWKPQPGVFALVVNKYEDKAQNVYDLFWPKVPSRLLGVVKNGVIKGFAPWELKLVNESR